MKERKFFILPRCKREKDEERGRGRERKREIIFEYFVVKDKNCNVTIIGSKIG
jgi:hypothetical protein